MKRIVNGQMVTMTPAEEAVFEASRVETIESKRETASLSRREFCLATVAAGLLQPAEAVEAARGGWPASFAAAVPPEQSVAAQIIWASANTVDRMDPLLIQVAASQSPPITDTQLDAMFGLL